jgi:TolB-like protein/DNA-binding winged helix-turn-helix (wHTH) protein/Flp pilus assembly protein TadD
MGSHPSAKQVSRLAEAIRFGVFELNTVTGELRKHGLRIKLQAQPFQVLSLLLARPGELVTREELHLKLWPGDTFVDFEQGLNKAINKLREALSDDRETPRYIETLPRRGYRFIAQVMNAQPPSERSGAPAMFAAQPDSGVTASPQRTRWRTPALFLLLGVMVLLASAVWSRWARQQASPPASVTTAAPIRSLAVLPLQNLSGGHDQEYFADGMTDELITDLGQMSALRVISRTSTVLYKGTAKPLPQIGRELGADAIVEGAVFRSGNRVRITAQLIDARTDHHVWAHTYERDLRDVMGLQDEVARDIANEISVQLTPQEQARLATPRPVNPDAYDAYMKGRSSMQVFNDVGVSTAIKYFERAIELDPAYAAPFAGLAAAYSAQGFNYFVPPREAYPRAKAAAAKALSLDENSADAYSSLCWTDVHFDWDWQAAGRDCTRALELDPNSPDAAFTASDYDILMGRTDEALVLLRQSVERDPLAAGSHVSLGWGCFESRRYDDAIAAFRQALALDPMDSRAWVGLGHTYVEKKMYPEAVNAYGRSAALKNYTEVADLGHAYGRAGERDKALKALEELKQLSQREHVAPGAFAFIYTGLGDKDQAFEWLDKAYEERDTAWFPMIRVNPMSDPLRSDPRFQDLIRRLGL